MTSALDLAEAARWMRYALELGRRGRGTTSPNPMVGAVVLRDGQLVGEGFHRRAGGPHAEIFALEDAGEMTKGATLIVTLEPCSHVGRTPPCVDAIIREGIKCVYVGTRDPNPKVSGRGIKRLRDAGIEVFEGVEESACRALIRPFATWITSGRPYTILKLASSIDNRVAMASGESQWITGEDSRRAVHHLRAEVDAILVGKGTAEVDNPRLTARDVPIPSGRQPDRIVVDTSMSLSPELALFSDEDQARRILMTSALEGHEAFEARGVEVWPLPGHANGVDLTVALERLATQRVRPTVTLLVEGGAGLATSLLKADLIDELRLFVGPLLLGEDGMNAFGALGFETLAEAPRFRTDTIIRHEEDVEIRYLRERDI